jgi:hypothetical protein
LKNAASQLTLRPKRPLTPSGRASVTSSPESVLSQDRKSSFANTPQLPEFSFLQSTSPGLGLHPETLGTDGYISRFGYGLEPETQGRTSVASSTEDTPPASAVFEYSLHSHPSKEDVDLIQDHNASSDARRSSPDTSLDVVEDDLDYLRARMSYLDATRGNKRQSGGPLPKRTSIWGVFDESDSSSQIAAAPVREPNAQENLMVPAQHKAPHKKNLPQLSIGESGKLTLYQIGAGKIT